MTTKTTKKTVKKKATTVNNNKVVMTAKQAMMIKSYLDKNGKTFKFLDTKINEVNA